MSEKVNVTNQFVKTNCDVIEKVDNTSGAGAAGGKAAAAKQANTVPDTIQK